MKQTVRTTGKAGQISLKANLLCTCQRKLMNWVGFDFKGNVRSLWRTAVLQPVSDSFRHFIKSPFNRFFREDILWKKVEKRHKHFINSFHGSSFRGNETRRERLTSCYFWNHQHLKCWRTSGKKKKSFQTRLQCPRLSVMQLRDFSVFFFFFWWRANKRRTFCNRKSAYRHK